MRALLPLLFASAALGAVALSAACSSSSSGPSCTAYTTSIDLKTPTVSYKNDVQPIFDLSCAFTSCHGGGTGSLKMVKGDPAATRTALVGVPAPQLASMKLVAPSDPTNSYILKKMDGDICTLASQCVAPCSDTMPQGNDLLDVAQRDVVRRWIAQGAADN